MAAIGCQGVFKPIESSPAGRKNPQVGQRDSTEVKAATHSHPVILGDPRDMGFTRAPHTPHPLLCQWALNCYIILTI